MTQAVTELVVRGDGALATLDRFEDKMLDAGQATERSTGAIDQYNAAMARYAAAQEKGLAITTQSVARRSAEERAMERWQATLSKTARLEVQFRREAERAAIDMANAVALGYTTPQHAVSVLTALEQKHAQQLRESAAAARQLNASLADTGTGPRGRSVVAGSSFNTANIAAQFQDIGVTAAMGMNPMQIALQQGTQLVGVMQTMERPLQGIVAAFAALISPLSLVTIGLVALVAAGLQMVNWAKAGAAVVTTLAGGLAAIAPYAAMAAAGLALLYAPAIIGGIVQLIALLPRLAVSATMAAGAMAAANPGVAFVLGITAAVAALTIFRKEIEQALGVDLIGKLKTVGNYIINAFRAAFSDVKFVWEQLPTVMDAAARGAGNMLIAGFERAINYLLGRIKDFYRAITPGAAIADAIGGSTSNIWGTGLIPSSVTFDRIQNDSADKLQQDSAAHAADITKIMSQDTLGDIGSGIAKSASLATGKLKELADWMGKVDDKKKKHHGKTDAENYADIIAGADRRISSLIAEQDALGLTEEAAASLRYEQDLLNQAQQKGIDLTPKQASYFKLLADTMAGYEAATKKTREALAFGKDLVKGFIGDLRSGLEQGKSFWESFGQAASNVLDKIIDKMLNNLIDAIFQVNSASGSSGGGGFFGNLFGWIGKLFGFAGGGYTGTGSKWQPAGIVHANEYVFSSEATNRIGVRNLDALHRAAKGYAGGGPVAPAAANVNLSPSANQNVAVDVRVGVSVDDDGRIRAYVQSAERRATQAGAALGAKQVRSNLPGLMAEAQARDL